VEKNWYEFDRNKKCFYKMDKNKIKSVKFLISIYLMIGLIFIDKFIFVIEDFDFLINNF
jgi:hypothetical protein